MADIRGACEAPFEAVRSALARNLDSGEEPGASLVVDIDGQIVGVLSQLTEAGARASRNMPACTNSRYPGWPPGRHGLRAGSGNRG